jgi:hypothetical protein
VVKVEEYHHSVALKSSEIVIKAIYQKKLQNPEVLITSLVKFLSSTDLEVDSKGVFSLVDSLVDNLDFRVIFIGKE